MKPSLLSRSALTIEEYKTLLISDDFPDPDTPVIHVSKPIGISTSILFKLFACAFLDRNPFIIWIYSFLGPLFCFSRI